MVVTTSILVNLADVAIAKEVLKACYLGGVRVFEFTNRGDFAHEVFAELNTYCIQHLPDMILGIGSVIDAPTAALYLQLGANFIVAPVVHAETAKTCNRRKVAWLPGCATLTEIAYAEELGAEVVKIFPGTQVGGPDYVRAVKGPMPWCSIMPTGGVTPEEESLKAWFQAGVHCVGIGSQLIAKHIITDKAFDLLQATAQKAITLAAKYRQ